MSRLTESEQEIIRRAQTGDRASQAWIVEKYEQIVYNLALRLTGNTEEAECVMQETFLKVLEALPTFRGESQLGTWIYRIAANFALMRLRKRKTVNYSLDEYVLEEERDFSKLNRSLEKDPEALLINSELKSAMDNAIEALPPKYKSAFVLKDVEGLKLNEVADILGMNLATVKTNVRRARLFLRDRLAEFVEKG